MTENYIVLSIEKLAGLGDGLAIHDGQRVFVPYTVAGDVVRARITRRTVDAAYAVPEEILEKGQGRVKPACMHFGICGGCALQHVEDEFYEDFKQQTAREAVRKAGFDAGLVWSLVRLPPAGRRRVDLKIESGRLGYYAERSHRLVEMEECKVLEPALEALILRLKPSLVGLPMLTDMHINGVDGGYDIVLSGEIGKWLPPEEKDILRVSVQRGGSLRLLHQSGPVTLTLGGVKVDAPPRAFLQASSEAQMIMTRQVLEDVGKAGKVLDLFSGLGTYSFPLTAQAEVTAVEGDFTMVRAMQDAITRHGLKERINASRRDLFHHPLAVEALKGFDAVVINPPRNGAKEQTAMLARSKVKKLVMISCNPATFSRDARLLKEGGYRLLKAVPIDQFVYSPHLEIIAAFTL